MHKKIMVEEKGVRRTFWLSHGEDDLVEQTRKKLGMTRSSFCKYAIMRFLDELGVLKEVLKKKEND